MKKAGFILIVSILLFPVSNTVASDFSGMDDGFRIFGVSIFLGLESFIVFILFFLKKFNNKIYRDIFNCFTAILFLIGFYSILSFAGIRFHWYWSEIGLLGGLLLGSGIISIILPNYQYKKWSEKNN